MNIVIFSSSDLLIRLVKAGDSRICVVSFSSFTDDPRLDRPGFGESFLRDRGVDAIHVINRTNVWYQYRELPEALHAICAVTQLYDNVFAYGSSMGGYAAIRFAEAVGARTAIAISPQYSVSPNIVPFDRRWHSIARRINFLQEPAFTGSKRVEPLVFYDPRDADAKHFELVAMAYPKTTGVRLWHAGHPAGAYLSEIGVLSSAIADIVHGRFDAAAFEKSARALRRRSGQYLFTLARRLPPWRQATKRRLATMAAERHEDAVYLIYLSLLVESTGDVDAAERHLRRAIEVLPDHPAPLRAMCVFLARSARFREAVCSAEKLISIDPERGEYARLLRLAMLGARDFARVPYLVRAPAARTVSSRFTSLAIGLSAATGVNAAFFTTLRPFALARFRHRYSLEKELDLFDEWRRRRRRKGPICSARPTALFLKRPS